MEGFNFNSIESNSWDVYIQTLILRHYRHLRNELWFEDTKGGCLSKDLLSYQEPQYNLSYQGMKETKYIVILPMHVRWLLSTVQRNSHWMRKSMFSNDRLSAYSRCTLSLTLLLMLDIMLIKKDGQRSFTFHPV